MSLFLAALLLASPLPAQEVSPAVQTLYADAQAKQAAHEPEAAIADYRKMIQLAPTLVPAYNNLGRLLYNAGRFPEAAATLQKALELQPDLPPAEIMLGASLFQLGQLEKAVQPLQAGVAAIPGDRFARLTLARALTGLDRPQDAIAQLDALIQADPKDQEAWYLLGKLHLDLSRQAFTRVQAIDNNTPLAHELAGELMEDMSNTPGAIAEYKQAATLAPDDPEVLERLANVYWHTGDWTRARVELTALIAKQPGNCYAHWKLGDSLDQLQEPGNAAMREVNTALEQCPDLAQARAERAKLLVREGKAAAALPDLEAAERAAPDEPSTQRLLAEAYRALGDHAKEQAANQRFVQLEQAGRAAQERKAARVTQANQ